MAGAVEMTRTEPKMNTLTKTPRVRSSSFVVIGLVMLLGSVPSCYIEAKIGNDPDSEGQLTDGEEYETTTSSTSAGFTSGQPATATASSTTSSGTTTGGDPSGTVGGTAGMSPEMALEACGVVLVPPVPDGPLYQEGIECSGGCSVDVENGESVHLYEHGECICNALNCGELIGGTTGEFPGVGTDTGTGGEPDGCGPFPPGDGGFTCTCEMCSIDVNSVDFVWLDTEADLSTICECMCGGAGCGSPV